MSFSIHKMPKLEKFLLLTAIFSGLSALVIATASVTTSPLSTTGEAQVPAQTVRSWNFTYSKEYWKSYPIWESFVRNGIWNIKIGPATPKPIIFNRQALAKLIYPLKYLTVKLAIVKNTAPPNPTLVPATGSTDALTSVDQQILKLPLEVSQTTATSPGTVCTADAMTCPDGSFVSRVPPACQFAPCPQTPYQTFEFNLYYKKLASSSWSGPIPLTGKISPNFQEFFFKFPETGLLTLEALKIEFTKGVSQRDIVKIDSITLKNEKPLLPTAAPTNYRITRTPTPFRPSPTKMVCVTPPPCYYGIKDPAGNTVYCLPAYPDHWCPRPTPTWYSRPTLTPYPTKPWPSVYPTCVPYPDNCITWINGRATMTCQFIRAENWCPLPTCIPRPRCLDTEPRCLIPETENMCPPAVTGYPYVSKYPYPTIEIPPPRY